VGMTAVVYATGDPGGVRGRRTTNLLLYYCTKSGPKPESPT
jgi:hypothetical protein